MTLRVKLRAIHNPGLPVSLRLGSLELTAFSVSGLATYVLVPAFDACFDLGHCPVEATTLRNVFLSHVHQDHAGGVHRHLSMRQTVGTRPSRIWCPAESSAALVDLLRAWERLEERPATDLDARVHAVRAGDECALGGRYIVRVFDVVHRIASRGFTVLERRRTLRAPYVGLPGADIHAARLRGEVVTDERLHPVFTYVGDSTVATLQQHPELGKSDVLFFEATHLPGTDRAVSARWGHTHLDELVALWHEAPATLASPYIVIKHFSMKYEARDVRNAAAGLPEGLRERVTMLVAS
jgi:ribonuclease Z